MFHEFRRVRIALNFAGTDARNQENKEPKYKNKTFLIGFDLFNAIEQGYSYTIDYKRLISKDRAANDFKQICFAHLSA